MGGSLKRTADHKRSAERRRDGKRNCVRSLLRTQSGRQTAREFRSLHTHETFRRFGCATVLDTHCDELTRRFKLSFLRRRSFVTEVIPARGVLIALVASGVCVAFDPATGRRLCMLNVRDDEVVRSIFHNKVQDSLITISVFRDDNFGSLKCRSVPLEAVRRGEPSAGEELFAGERLQWPGFVELDDTNNKVLTFSATAKVHTVWDLEDFRPVFRIADPAVNEIKISPGVALLIYQRQQASIPLSIVDIETGALLRKMRVPLLRGRAVDFIEQFDTRLLVKQEGSPLRVIDLEQGGPSTAREVPESVFATPAAFIFLYERQLFLTFRNNAVSVWNRDAQRIATFDNQLISFADINSNSIFITREQDLILSYYKKDFYEPGVIHVSSISTGKCLAKIEHTRENGGSVSGLQDVTALSYDEVRGEIYAGSRDGKLYVFKPGGHLIDQD